MRSLRVGSAPGRHSRRPVPAQPEVPPARSDPFAHAEQALTGCGRRRLGRADCVRDLDRDRRRSTLPGPARSLLASVFDDVGQRFLRDAIGHGSTAAGSLLSPSMSSCAKRQRRAPARPTAPGPRAPLRSRNPGRRRGEIRRRCAGGRPARRVRSCRSRPARCRPPGCSLHQPAAPACTTITLTQCATMSCRSRATRLRLGGCPGRVDVLFRTQLGRRRASRRPDARRASRCRLRA